jgi:nucleotide-binding universal stress UspA family protein
MRSGDQGRPEALYRSVMVAVDNSPCSGCAVDRAVELAVATGARLTGYHVYAATLHDTRFRQLEPGLPEGYRPEAMLNRLRSIHNDLIGHGLGVISDSYLDRFAERCQQAGLEADRRSAEGRNYLELVRSAAANAHDLVAIGAHGLGRVDRSVLGSVCERVARLVDCDLLVAREDRPIRAGSLLVALDGSDTAFHAMGVALGLARLFGSEVVAVAAYDPFFHGGAFQSIATVLSPEASRLFRFQEQEKLHDDIIDDGLSTIYRSHLEQANRMADAAGIPFRYDVIEGKPFDAIAGYALKLRPSLLLAGRTGIHHCDGVTLGSTVENLLRCVESNVLLVGRQPAE